jgi:Mg-chelatase subunit ChlI
MDEVNLLDDHLVDVLFGFGSYGHEYWKRRCTIRIRSLYTCRLPMNPEEVN